MAPPRPYGFGGAILKSETCTTSDPSSTWPERRCGAFRRSRGSRCDRSGRRCGRAPVSSVEHDRILVVAVFAPSHPARELEDVQAPIFEPTADLEVPAAIRFLRGTVRSAASRRPVRAKLGLHPGLDLGRNQDSRTMASPIWNSQWSPCSCPRTR